MGDHASYFQFSLSSSSFCCSSSLTSMVSSSNGSSELKKPFQRLPKAAVPTHYEIFLRPNLVDLVFTGTIKVTNTIISGWFRNFYKKSVLFQFFSAFTEEFPISVQLSLCSKLLNKLKKNAQKGKIPHRILKKIEILLIFPLKLHLLIV